MGVEWQSFHSGQETPQNAIRAGQEANGEPFFVARGKPEESHGGVNPGKFGPTTGRGVLFPAGGKELYAGHYDLLVGDESSIKWVDFEGTYNGDGNPVEGGHEEDGTPLFIAQADYEGGVFPGKAGPKLNGVNFGYGGKEVTVQKYRVLVHA